MKKRLLFSVAAFLITLTQLFAQGGNQIRISGKVSDKITGEPIPGVIVSVKDSKTGVTTSLDGTYSILVLKTSTDLVYSFIGYQTETIAINDQRYIDVSLKPAVKELGAVEITAQAKGQMAARIEQINSMTIKNVVSAERLRENPDANAVEAIGRLPGITVDRSGGEGAGLKIRGLGGDYTAITMNGVKLPSTGSDRSTNISGIPQNMLQGVEVYKSLTADQDADAVGGTINLRMREAPNGFHSNIVAQGGYNHLNSDFRNYKIAGEISKRFLKNKLGIYISGNIERTNRSIENITDDLSPAQTSEASGFVLKSLSLNKIKTIKYRRSVSLSVDYRLSSSTKLALYSMYNYSNNDHERQTKNYSSNGNGGVDYNFHKNPYANDQVFFNTLSGQTNLKFLNIVIDYGISYSKTIQKDPDSRTWSTYFTKPMTYVKFDTSLQRHLDPTDIKPLYKDNDSLPLSCFNWMEKYKRSSTDMNLTPYIDVKLPYKFSDKIFGFIKFGGKYIRKKRLTDVSVGGMQIETNIDFRTLLKNQFDFINYNPEKQDQISINGMETKQIPDFLNGDYNYGWYFDFNKLNQITDWWDQTSIDWWNKGESKFLSSNGGPFGNANRLYYSYDISRSIRDDENIIDNTYAAYAMTEFNYGKWLTFLPGVRYENVNTIMKGWYAQMQSTSFNMLGDFPKTETKATNKNEFFLPMIHLRIRPMKIFYLHFSYTQTLKRPNFSDISPNTFVYSGFGDNSKTMKNPYLRPELWTNLDAQLTFHNPKIGLLSITAFHKNVKDKIVGWNYLRIKGDSIIQPFRDADNVNVSYITNHDFNMTIKGIEAEWQTSFYYLPGFLKYFVLTLNYTYQDSKTQYWTWKNVPGPPDDRGRPGPSYRKDSIRTDRMSGVPVHIGNVTLGFEKKRFKTFISYQYTGNKRHIDARVPLYDSETLYFNRIDMQVSYALPIRKLKGTLTIVANGANLTNHQDINKKVYDARYNGVEAYGWTADLGLRFNF